jgi:hypothetical protein
MSDPMGSGRASAGEEAQFVAPGRPGVRSPDGQLAAGHRPAGDLVAGAPGMTEHLNFQQVRPSAATVVYQHGGGPLGPLAESVTGAAVIAQLDQARASNGSLESQLGPRMPSPVPGQPPEHTAVTDRGAPFRENAPRQGPGATYSREPKPS